MAKYGASDAAERHPWRTYRRLLGCVRPYAGRLAAGFFFGLLYSAANGAFVWVIRGGVREFLAPAGAGVDAQVVLLAVGFPVIALLRGTADYFSAYLISWVGNRVVMDLRNAMFRHIHGLSVDYFTNSRTGELISRTTNDTLSIERSVAAVISDLAKQPLTLLFMVGTIFTLDARLACVSIVVFPICVLPIGAFGRRVRRNASAAQQRIADVVSILEETVGGVRIVKAFGMEEYENRKFAAQTAAFFGRVMRVTRASAIVEPIIVLIASFGVLALLYYVRRTHMPLETFFAFVAAYFMMYEPVKKLGKIHLHIEQSSASADRIFEVLDTPSTVSDRPGATELAAPVREIVFERVGFRYDARPVLNDISFTVLPGEKIAFVGGSGAGKTTLVNLLPRFYDVTAGRVLINGRDVRDVSLRSLRAHIGLVTQDTFLFNDTVAGNIAYGSQSASRETVEAAARRAHAHEFIAQMPDGYDTLIGERGVRLSGGQRQRLAIARAILRDPPILILDEATSALDTESERMVQMAIDALIAGRTVFAIAHRLSTIANCTRIVVLDAGRIVEQGSHAELLAAGGAYKRLYDMQFDVGGDPAAAGA